jgi:hypothetical protein
VNQSHNTQHSSAQLHNDLLRIDLFTQNMSYMLRNVVQHHAAKVGLDLNCVAWCRTTQRDKKNMFGVNRPLSESEPALCQSYHRVLIRNSLLCQIFVDHGMS